MPPERRSATVDGYVTAVAAAGGAALIALLASLRGDAHPPTIAAVVLGLLVVFGELMPFKIRRRDQEGEITTSLTFAYALLIVAGTPIAAAALCLASGLADVLRRKPVSRIVFNISQYTLALAAGGLVLGALSGPAPLLEANHWTILAIFLALAAGGVTFAANWILTGTVVALAQSQSIVGALRRDFPFTASTSGVLLTLAPVLVLIAHENVLLLPVLLTTVGALYLTAGRSLAGRHEAEHDQLTGLANRRLLDQRLEEALADGPHAALLVIDLDRFKHINDTFGHDVGDAVLRAVADRIAGCVRETDTAARLGGDEFAVLIPDPDPDLPEACARRILEALRTPVEAHGFPLEIAGSVGVSVGPQDGTTSEELVRHADHAMYRAKRTGSGYVLARRDNEEQHRGRLALLADLRRAIDADEFELHYQPLVQLSDGTISGVEALVRWRHPDHGLIAPNDFMPLAEQTDLIAPFTRLVLDKALAQARVWHDQGHMLRMSVNLGVANLYDVTLPGDIAALLGEHEIEPFMLTVEITENTVMADPDRVRSTLKAIAGMGVRIAIDDFGTGYSSLLHLKQLPVSHIKIDRSFVSDMQTDAEDAVIVRSIIDLARNLALHVTAEGVETPEVFRALTELGCDVAQGHLFAPPAPAAEITMWMNGYQATRELEARTTQTAAGETGDATVVAFPQMRRVAAGVARP